MPKFINAIEGPKNTVIYTDSSGALWEYRGGDRNWRNNNPGNVVPGEVSKRNGAIGKAAGFSAFPTYEEGHKALLDSLLNVHGNKDIPKLMEKFAPPFQNNTKRYISFIRKETGVKDNKKIKDFTKEEFEKLWRSIEKMEGSRPGKISPIQIKKNITSVKKDKHGLIVQYYVQEIGWLNKNQAISMVKKGIIDAVIATSSKGNKFLKSRPNKTSLDNLEKKS